METPRGSPGAGQRRERGGGLRTLSDRSPPPSILDMRLYTRLFIVALAALLVASPVTSITNPIHAMVDEEFEDMADPAVLEHDGFLHVFPTASQADFSAWSAQLPAARDDAWDPSTLSFERSSEPVLTPEEGCIITTLVPALGKGSLTWAPHVYHDEAGDGRFYVSGEQSGPSERTS